MAQKNLCALIPLELHERVTQEKDRAGQTIGQYITNLLTEYYTIKENGGTTMAENRTMAFQISEELYQRIKRHLERESARAGKKLTQRKFILGLVEEALAQAEVEEGGEVA